MKFDSGWFAHPHEHHREWFKVYRFTGAVEVWFGHRWYLLSWR